MLHEMRARRHMSYTLEAILGSESMLRDVLKTAPQAPAVLVPLTQGIAMIPMTDELFDAVADGTPSAPLGFWKLPGGFDKSLAVWSAADPLAYVEAELFGGIGSQRTVVWSGGHVAVGPLSVEEAEPFSAAGSPISQALQALGVQRADQFDEFAAVGLSAHRDTQDRLPSPLARSVVPVVNLVKHQVGQQRQASPVTGHMPRSCVVQTFCTSSKRP